ncbi:hypothetical protein PIB30_084558 [Stylosanthes scabra]|uniref:Uncharacterized protein n=1 Tax=Stylosanthes scabra TaxID=79078 RepID=A0ABU6URD9_9FABA|nr:hypothetical protein [Stylosanthes scabra]
MPATLKLSAVPSVNLFVSSDNQTSNGRFRRRSQIHDTLPREIKSAFRSLAKLYHFDVAAVRQLPDSETSLRYGTCTRCWSVTTYTLTFTPEGLLISCRVWWLEIDLALPKGLISNSPAREAFVSQ